MSDNPFLASVPKIESQSDTTTDNPFIDMVASDMQQQADSIRTSLSVGMDTLPDDQAKRLQLSRTTGLPTPVVAARQVDIEKKSKLDEIDYVKLVRDNPNLSRWLSKPDNAAIAHDDVENLGALELTLGALGAGVDRAQAGFQNAGAGLLNFNDAINNVARKMGFPVPDGNLSDAANSLRSDAKLNLDAVKLEGAKREDLPYIGKMVLGGLESVLPSLGAVSTSLVTRNPALAYAQFGLPSFGNALQDGLNQGLDPISATLHGARQGGLEAATEMLSFGPLMKAIKDKDSFVKMVGGFIGRDVFGEEINTVLGNFESWQALPDNANKSLAEFASEQPSAMMDTFFQTLFGAGATAGAIKAIQTPIQLAANRAASKTKRDIETNINAGEAAVGGKTKLDNIVQAASESKLRNRDADAFAQYVRHVSPDQTVSLNAEDAGTFFQSSPEAAQRLQENNPEVYAQLAISSATGSDVVIPLDAYLTDLADYHEQLGDKLKVGDNPMSYDEYQNSSDALQTEISKEAEKVMAEASSDFNKSLAQVSQTFRESLQVTGRYTDDVIDKYAQLAESITATMAQRTGLTPEEFASKYNLIATTPEQRIAKAQQKADYTDKLIYHVRSGTVPTDSDIYGQNLTEFLRDNGGLRDSGGELKARDLKESTGKAFKKNLVRPDGNELDQAAELAHEAGFIQERDINQLLEALDQEQLGVSVYSAQNTNSELEQVAMDAAGIEQALDGKDISNMSNADVQAILFPDENLYSNIEANKDNLAKNTISEYKVDGVEKGGVYEVNEQLDLPLSDGGMGRVSRTTGSVARDRVRLQKTGEMATGITKVTSSADAAHIIASLRKEAQENLVALVLDKDNNAVSVIEHTTGGADRAAVFPGMLAGAITSTPGAHSYYIAHNHPSDTAQLSDADVGVLNRLNNLTTAAGINGLDILAVTPDGKYAGNFGSNLDIPTAPRTSKVSIKTRRIFGKIKSEPINRPDKLGAAVEVIAKGKTGVILTDIKMRPVRFVEISIDDMRHIKGTPAAGEYLKAVHSSNALKQFVVGDGEFALTAGQNMQALGNMAGLKTQDVYHISTAKSFVSVDMFNPHSSKEVFFQAEQSHTPRVPEIDLDGKPVAEQLDMLIAAYPDEAASLADRRGVVKMVKLKRLNKTGSMQAQEVKHDLVDKIEVAKKKKDRAFTRWFGNSVVTDSDGKPKVVYHGTGAKVSDSFIFDYSRIGEQGRMEGAGFYFTENKNIADGYGGKGTTLDVYLSIENPISYEQEGFDAETVKDILSKMAQAEVAKYGITIGDGFLSNFGDVNYEGLDAVLESAAESFDGMSALDQLSSMVGAGGDIELVNRAAHDVTGHDGVVTDGFSDQGGDKIYVAFFPEQIKSTKAIEYDKSNPDIFFQGEKNRGSITFPKGELDSAPSLLAIMENADLSTVLHEMGHFYFEVMNHVAIQPDAPADVVNDMNTLLDWLGIDSLNTWNNMTVNERRAAHEQTAEAFERYLMEGKAPSSKLRELFRTLKAWMMTVYRAIAPGANLSDDVRGVFDRLVATEDEISQAQSEMSAVAMFSTPEDAGMTDDEYAAYVKDQQTLIDNAERDLSSQYIHDMQWLDGAVNKALKALQREERAKRKAMRDEVAAEVNSRPVYQARSLLITGKLPDGTLPNGIEAVKFSVDDLHAMYGTDADAIWRALPNAMKRKKDGVHPDVVAAWFGYSSGDALVLDLAAAAKPNDVIKSETEKRLLERYGIIKNDEQLRVAALAAVHNKAHERMVSTEYKALNIMVGKRDKLTMQAIRDYADTTIGKTKVMAVKPFQYLTAERKAARASIEAFGKGDVKEAARQKRIQLIQRSLYTAANQAMKDRDSAVRYLKGFEKKSIRRKLSAEYLDQVKALLYQYDFRTTTQKEVRAREGLLAWMAKEFKATGVEPNIPEKVLNRAQRIHYTNVSMDELRALKTAVREIDYFGRFKKKLLDNRKKIEIKEAVQAAIISMEQHNEIGDEVVPYAKSIKDKLTDTSKKWGSALLNVESLLRRLDGDQLGALWHSIFLPISEATDKTFARKREAAKYFRELIESTYTVKERALFGGIGAKKYRIDGLEGDYMTKENIIAVAMNWGNAEGRDRLINGNKFSASQIEQMLSHLDEKDLRLMDEMWRYFDEKLWPDLAKLEREVHGEAPAKVDPMPYEVNGVEVRGGYYPLKYDRTRGEQGKRIDDTMSLDDFSTGKSSRAATKQGAAKDRVEHVGAALRTDLGAFSQGINEAIHDIEMRRAVIDVYRTFSDAEFERTFKGAAGKEAYDLLLPWLRDAAVPPESPTGGIAQFIAKARHNTAVVAMGFSVKTAYVNLSGILQSMDASDVGKGRIMKWVAKFAHNPVNWKKHQKFIFDRSKYMTDRAATMDRDVREQMNKMSVAGTLTPKASTYFILITLSDKAVAIPTWMAAYEKAMSDNGNNEIDAVRFADHIIRTTQGGGREIDLSFVQRGEPGNRELYKAFTMFYSYFNTTLNRNIRAVDLLRRNGLKGTPEFIASMLFINILPAVIGAIMAGYGPDDDDDPFAWAAVESVKFGLGQVPIVRDVGSYIVNQMAGKYQYLPLRATPLEGSFQDMIVGPYRVASDLIDGEADEQTAKKAILSAGYWVGLPSRQMWRTSEHIMHVMDDQSDFSPVDLLMGEKHK